MGPWTPAGSQHPASLSPRPRHLGTGLSRLPPHHASPLGHRPGLARAAATCRLPWRGQGCTRAPIVVPAASRLPGPGSVPQPPRSRRRHCGRAASVLSSVRPARSPPPALVLPGRRGGAAAPTCSPAPARSHRHRRRAQGRCSGGAGSLWHPGGGSQPQGAPPRYTVPSVSCRDSGA
jgi:hypothetical protein